MREQDLSALEGIFMQFFTLSSFYCCALLVFDHCAWPFGSFHEFSLDDLCIYGVNREQQFDKPKTGPTGNFAK